MLLHRRLVSRDIMQWRSFLSLVKDGCLLQAGRVSEPVLAALTRRILTGLLQLHKGRHTVRASSIRSSTKVAIKADCR